MVNIKPISSNALRCVSKSTIVFGVVVVCLSFRLKQFLNIPRWLIYENTIQSTLVIKYQSNKLHKKWRKSMFFEVGK